MSTSRCGNICLMPPKCSRKERRRGFSNRNSVDEAMTGRRCVFLFERKSTLFGLPKVDAIRNHWLRLFTTEQHNPNVRICATHFMDDSFVNRGEYKAGCLHLKWHKWHKGYLKKKKKKVNSDLAMTIWCF